MRKSTLVTSEPSQVNRIRSPNNFKSVPRGPIVVAAVRTFGSIPTGYVIEKIIKDSKV